MRQLRHPAGYWALGLEPGRGLVFLGLDSEGTGREKSNLLLEPPSVRWAGAGEAQGGGAALSVEPEGEGFRLSVTNTGGRALEELTVELPMNALMAATVLIPSALDERNRGLGPWLLVAPDFGHLVVRASGAVPVWAENDGVRGWSPGNAPMGGVDPALRGDAWREAARPSGYRPGRLALRFVAASPVGAGEVLGLCFAPAELQRPPGIEDAVWRRLRRPYLNHWQPCGTWAGPSLVNLLANNVLSDPASCSLHHYSEPALFWHEPVPGIDLRNLVRHTLDYWLDHAVSAQGHVNAFGSMYDLYTFTGTSLLTAAWHYWKLSGDHAWLHRRLTEGYFPVLHRMADYLVRRDVDGDGLIESLNSGNSGSLREPERADIWYGMMNFGWKNAYTNALVHRSFLCLAEMMESDGLPRGAAYYRGQAARLREAYVSRFLGRNGWFVSWVSLDGEAHDYCHTFVNGAAVAFGLVSAAEGRAILERVVRKSHSIGFACWHLGVPGNLISCNVGDLIGPKIGLDGLPDLHTFAIEDDEYWGQARFGHRYPNGTLHPALVWPYLLGLQVAGLRAEADRLLDAMIESAVRGLFQNGIVNAGYGGAEHFNWEGRTLGYEGYLPESFNFLMAAFTRDPVARASLSPPGGLPRAAASTPSPPP